MAIDQSVISALMNELKKKQDELVRIEELTKTIPALRADIVALERTRGILLNGSGEEEKSLSSISSDSTSHTSTVSHGSLLLDLNWMKKSIEEQVVDIFRKHGDLGGDELADEMHRYGSTASRHTIMGAIYRSVKDKGEKSPFRKVKPGVFGLKENAPSVAS